MSDERVDRNAAVAPERPVITPLLATGPTTASTPQRTTRRIVQAKLRVGAADDPFEREADRVAAQVMRQLALGRAADIPELGAWVDPAGTRVRRAVRNRRADRSDTAAPSTARSTPGVRIQRRDASSDVGWNGGTVDDETDAAIRRRTGRGAPLDGALRASMEHGFGADFSTVRVHADGAADQLNRSVQARAFTTGSDIFFARGQYSPSSRAGQELVAHELAHVVQQGATGVMRRPAPQRIRRSDDPGAGASPEPTVSKSGAGAGRSKLTLSGGDGVVGSVTVSTVDRSSVEATNLAVDASHRGRGFGSDLIAAAAHAAEDAGRSQVVLGSQDNGSGRLDSWYSSLGFRKTGTETDNTSRFRAPTAALRRRTSTRHEPAPASSPPIRRSHLRERTTIRRMQPDWYELVGDDIVGRMGKKPAGYKLVKGRTSPEKTAVFETDKQRKTKVVKEPTYAQKIAGVPPDGTPGDFEVQSDLVRFSQDSIGKTFTSGALIADLVVELKAKRTVPDDLPPIRISMTKLDRLVTLDNRRLWCCQQAGTTVKCRWATPDEVKKDWKKFTAGSGKGLTTITVRK